MPKIPHCDTLFKRFFAPWYDPEDRARLGWGNTTRPDTLRRQSLIGKTADELSCLNQDGARKVIAQVRKMSTCALSDSARYLKGHSALSLEWVEDFDRYWTTKRIADLISKSDVNDSGNDYFILCCEFGAAMGEVIREQQPRLVWVADWPYWESALFDPKTGTIILPVHWAIKKMSSYGVDDGFADKIGMLLQMLEEEI
jgi:hypothetical protein